MYAGIERSSPGLCVRSEDRTFFSFFLLSPFRSFDGRASSAERVTGEFPIFRRGPCSSFARGASALGGLSLVREAGDVAVVRAADLRVRGSDFSLRNYYKSEFPSLERQRTLFPEARERSAEDGASSAGKTSFLGVPLVFEGHSVRSTAIGFSPAYARSLRSRAYTRRGDGVPAFSRCSRNEGRGRLRSARLFVFRFQLLPTLDQALGSTVPFSTRGR
jgi:hypothetical protein